MPDCLTKPGNVILVFCVVVVYSQFLVMFMFVFWSSNHNQTKSPANKHITKQTVTRHIPDFLTKLGNAILVVCVVVVYSQFLGACMIWSSKPVQTKSSANELVLMRLLCQAPNIGLCKRNTCKTFKQQTQQTQIPIQSFSLHS